MTARTIELEKKVAQALKTYIAHRPQTFDQHVFLNRYGEPISERGIRKLVAKYVRAGGITKKASRAAPASRSGSSYAPNVRSLGKSA